MLLSPSVEVADAVVWSLSLVPGQLGVQNPLQALLICEKVYQTFGLYSGEPQSARRSNSGYCSFEKPFEKHPDHAIMKPYFTNYNGIGGFGVCTASGLTDKRSRPCATETNKLTLSDHDQ